MKENTYLTTDICDDYSDVVSITQPIFNDYGGVKKFHGRIVTVNALEDNVLVKKTLAQKVENCVLVVDGGGSTRCALLGDMLASMAHDNGWQGIIVNGCIRDSVEISKINIGVKALNTHPLKSRKNGIGEEQVSVTFANVTFNPADYLYADEDGIVVAKKPLFD